MCFYLPGVKSRGFYLNLRLFIKIKYSKDSFDSMADYEMSYNNLSFILKMLLDERADYADIAIPDLQNEQR